jgi:hypothetical protein
MTSLLGYIEMPMSSASRCGSETVKKARSAQLRSLSWTRTCGSTSWWQKKSSVWTNKWGPPQALWA